MCRAQEEIQRLNVEIRRVITFIHDEERFLRACKEKLKTIDPVLAHQISQRQKVHSQFNYIHMKRLHDISTLTGFSRILAAGESALKGPGESATDPEIVIPPYRVTPTQPAPFNQLHGGPQDTIQDLEEEEDVDFEAEEASQALQDVLEVTSDF